MSSDFRLPPRSFLELPSLGCYQATTTTHCVITQTSAVLIASLVIADMAFPFLSVVMSSNALTALNIFLWFVDRVSRHICVIKTNLMHCVSTVYFVSQSLHVSHIFVAHHQEVYCIYIYIYIQQLVRVVLFSQLKSTSIST